MSEPRPSRRAVLRALGATAVVGTTLPVAGARTATATESWREFGTDPANTGYAPGNAGPKRAKTQLWQFETEENVLSSPAVVGATDGDGGEGTGNATVYVGSNDGAVYAIAADDGTERWTFETDGLVSSSPAVVEGTVYVGSNDGAVYAIAADDGTERWSFETGGPVLSSPTVANGTVYVGSDDETVYAIATEDGSEEWSRGTKGPVWSSPAVVDGTVYVGNDSDDVNLYALDAEDGTVKWTFQEGAAIESAPTVVDAPTPSGGRERTLFVGDVYGFVYAIPAEREAPQTTTAGNSGDDEESASGRDSRWKVQTKNKVDGSPAVAEDTVYVGSNDGYLYALSAVDGSRQWRTETNGIVNSSPAVVDHAGTGDDGTDTSRTVYVGSVDGNLYAVNANDGEVRWTFDTDGRIYSSPAVANGAVHVGSEDDSLYAITEPETTPTPDGGGGGGSMLPTPGFGVFGTLAALGLGGWGLLRRNGSDDEE